MDQKSISEVSSGIRTAFQKANDAIRKNNTDYAIEILKGIVKSNPGFMDARKALRKQERIHTEGLSGFAKLLVGLKTLKFIAKGKTSLNKKPMDALKAAEDALAVSLNQMSALNLLADAAVELDAYFIAIEALEIALEYQPENQSNLRKLHDVYVADKQGGKALEVMTKLADLNPGDLTMESELRAAQARATMEQGNWEKDTDFKEKLASKDEAHEIEKEEITARSEEDIKERIELYEKRMANDPAEAESVDNKRKLGELYHRGGRYDDAIASYTWIMDKLGKLDPTIDKEIEKAEVAKLKESGEGAEEKILAYRKERAEDRVYHFPNDTQLRFDLAVVYWEVGDVDKSLEQFQLAQRNPQRRLTCLVYLGRCFAAKKQFDMSTEQFDKALSEMLVMDKQKMEALYYYGIAADDMGDNEKALSCFKDIYQANINYRDVKERMEKYYG